MPGGGEGCGVSANEYSTAGHRSPNKLRRGELTPYLNYTSGPMLVQAGLSGCVGGVLCTRVKGDTYNQLSGVEECSGSAACRTFFSNADHRGRSPKDFIP
jgi:hypothetical protein